MVVRLRADARFLFRNQTHLFVKYAQFFHFMLLSLSKIASNGVQKLSEFGISKNIYYSFQKDFHLNKAFI